MDVVEMTHRLYFDDAYIYEFDATVIGLSTFHGHPAVLLDQTAFYPEGGGQPGDQGKLHDRTVLDVQEQNGQIYHLLDDSLNVGIGATVHGIVQWARRYDFMQQHTGQHILSGAWYRIRGANTASWHLSENALTIDIDIAGITPDDVQLVEQAANEVIWSNVPIVAQFVSQKEMTRLSMRKGTTREGIVRIVSVGDFDRIGCGGTHVATSGQCGSISILNVESRGSNSRVSFACGARALHDHRRKTIILQEISQSLSVKQYDIVEATHRLRQTVEDVRRDNAALQRQVIGYEARALVQSSDLRWKTVPLVVCYLVDRSAAELKQVAQGIVDEGGIALLAGTFAGKVLLQFACSPDLPLEMNRILQRVLPSIAGKGGGQKFLAQGAGSDISQIDAVLADATYVVLQTAQD